MKRSNKSAGTFSNLRGLESGAERAGFQNIFSTDIEQKAADAFVLLNSNPEEVFIRKDIKELCYDDIVNALAVKGQCIETGELDLLLGGPPCFGMTGLNRYRSVFHHYNMLMFDMLRLVDELRPKTVIIEQVPILLSRGIKPFYELLKLKLNSMDYVWEVKVLNAANFGCYQSRKRAIFILVRKDLGVLPSFPEERAIDLSVQSALATIGAELIRNKNKNKDGKVAIKSGRLPFGTMTSQSMEVFRNNRWETLDLASRKKLAHMESVDLASVLPDGAYKDMLGNMVLPPFAEALAQHVLEEILLKSAFSELDAAA
jgi:site-specific DNA-cytosine methylase